MSEAAVAEQTAPTTPPPGGVPVSEAPVNGAGAPKVADDITASDNDGAAAASTWPDDWRGRFAGKDADALKRLNRFHTPEGIYKSWRSLEQRLSAGELRSKLPEDATEEQIAEWRKENGIPEKSDGYALPEVSGYEWGENDKPVVQEFLAAAHAANFDQPKIEAALGWYAQQQLSIAEKRYEADTLARQSLEDDLRTEWGPEFRGNVGLTKRYMDSIPEEGGTQLAAARMEDGSRLIDQPWFVKWVAGLARDTYGDDGMLAAGDGAAQGSNRMREIEHIMNTDMNRYFKEGFDKEYLALQRKQRPTR